MNAQIRGNVTKDQKVLHKWFTWYAWHRTCFHFMNAIKVYLVLCGVANFSCLWFSAMLLCYTFCSFSCSLSTLLPLLLNHFFVVVLSQPIVAYLKWWNFQKRERWKLMKENKRQWSIKNVLLGVFYIVTLFCSMWHTLPVYDEYVLTCRRTYCAAAATTLNFFVRTYSQFIFKS